jgi:hypothetical protein
MYADVNNEQINCNSYLKSYAKINWKQIYKL